MLYELTWITRQLGLSCLKLEDEQKGKVLFLPGGGKMELSQKSLTSTPGNAGPAGAKVPSSGWMWCQGIVRTWYLHSLQTKSEKSFVKINQNNFSTLAKSLSVTF